ncbi:MAG: aldehyde dehydrogenase family protein, partial [Anaerolineae bacterium]|nr:aldehyde dehydrogenase family protein [Anaerolineae bacterium]
QGKPLTEAEREVRLSAEIIDFLAEEAKRLAARGVPPRTPGVASQTVMRVPVGPVAAYSPWNFPCNLPARKLGGALAAGCSVVLKPDERTPSAAVELVRCFVDAGLPDGVINVVTGAGAVGAQLVQHPIVQKIAFTGSVGTGIRIGEQAARQMKRTTLELGGSAPCIVCADADLDMAVKGALRRAFSHTGQICISVNRIFVHESIFDAYAERFAAAARALRVTPDGLKEPDADMGPLINKAGAIKTQQHVEDALTHGARVLAGGDAPVGDEYDPGGYFYNATVLTDVTPDMRVMHEETFGPIAPLASFRTLEEAVALANGTPYGLASYVYTADLNSAFYLARTLRSGGIGINVNDITDIRGPFGGMKMSGIGRELGEPGLGAYLETKHIRMGYQPPRA